MQSDIARDLIQFTPRRLGHANLWVGDVNRNTRYYNRVFGLKIEATEPAVLASFLGNGNTHHDVGTVEITRGADRVGRDGTVQISKDVGTSVGLFHLGWEMENEADLVDAIARLRRAGHPVSFFADHQISHSVYIPDPDGNLHEFYADARIDWRSFFQGELDAVTSTWNPDEGVPTTDIRYDPNPTIGRVEDAPLHPRKISHVALVVSDMTQSTNWFTSVAGLTVLYRAPDDNYVELAGDLGNRDLLLFQAMAGESTGLHHITFDLESDADYESSIRSLKHLGIRIEMQVENAYKRSLFVHDPDGIRWQFVAQFIPDHIAISRLPPSDRRFLA